MGRKLFVCLDGTNNRYAATNTNVVKMYAMVDRTKPDQLGYYPPGIGTILPPGIWDKGKAQFIKMIDIAIACLLDDHVCDAYRFLMRYHQEGDEIFIFGFSRGAYTARVLAAMLHKVGLLSAGNEELIPFAWDMFDKETDENIYTGFRHTFARKVRIKFLGLWDTISSVGWAWNPKYYQFTADNPSVEIVRHAMALDERRTGFVQNAWTPDPPPGQDVREVWFAGVHGDLGGAYPEEEAGLSKLALQWMVKEAISKGLRFQDKAIAQILPQKDSTRPPTSAPNPLAPGHESLRGFYWLLEILPRRVRDPADGFKSRWIVPLGRPRFVRDGSTLHASVFIRKEKYPGYAPRNFPARYEIEPWR